MVSRVKPRCGLVTVTFAPATTAPDESVTMPEIVAWSWHQAATVIQDKRLKSDTAMRIVPPRPVATASLRRPATFVKIAFRSRMRRFVICAAGFFLLWPAACRRSGPRDANVLLITLDTTRADHLGS